MNRSSYGTRPALKSGHDCDLARLHNAHRILAKPDHPLRRQAVELRQELSAKWCDQATKGKWFRWPTTFAPQGTRGLTSFGWREHGILSLLGYRVGETQPTPQHIRRCILEFAFECYLPPLNDLAYYSEWGPPLTPKRL